MENIKFYSEQDLMCGHNLDKIIQLINDFNENKEIEINDILEFRNILEYLKIERFYKYVEEKISKDVKEFINIINKKMGLYINNIRDTYLGLYEYIDFNYSEDYFDIMRSYKIYNSIRSKNLRNFLIKENRALHYILKFSELVKYYDTTIKESILFEPNNIELILDKYLIKETLYLPESLTNSDIEDLLNKYLDLDTLNINQLRKIIFLPNNIELKFNDKLRLKAKKRLEKEEEKLFDGKSGIPFGATLKYNTNQNEAIKIREKGTELFIDINKSWITENLDYNTLFNNFIHLFSFFDKQCRLMLISKENEIGVLERAMSHSFDHLYNAHSFFTFKEMTANLEFISYSRLLNIQGIRIEEMIEWFFNSYLKEEFGIDNYQINMPGDYLSYLEKCRTIAPEIDRILKQYNLYIDEGLINEELFQITSKHLKFSECKSKIMKKHIYPVSNSSYYNNATFSLFSDQSHLFYITKFEERHGNLYELLKKEKVKLDDFNKYQKTGIQWLIENGLLKTDGIGTVAFNDATIISILKDLYNNQVISYWHLQIKFRKHIDEYIKSGVLRFENSLFSKDEQDYLDFYLNRSKFTNGYDLRNSYIHGTHPNDKIQHQEDYFNFLKIIIIIIIKINDDLCLYEESVKQC